MKNLFYKVSILTLFFLLPSISQAQDTLRIKTSAQCNTCKKTLEYDMKFEKGVEKVSLDVESRVLTVVYNPAKTDPAKLRLAVSKVGYDADDVKADPKAYNKLEECCKKGEHQH